MSTLAVEGLRVMLPTPAGEVTVVDGVDYDVQPAEVFGIAGESGSGKTVSMLALLGLLPDGSRVEGTARFGGDELIGMPRRRLQSISGRDIAMVFQDPYTSLHPMLSIGKQLTEHVRRHLGLDRRSADDRAVELLQEVRIPNPRAALRRFPHQFSGGMRQRIAIAIALACRPRLLIADEPTTALDVTVQAGILRLLDRLRREHELAVVLITHDLGVLSSVADRVSIFYAGRVVESGPRAGRPAATAPSVHARPARRAAAPGGAAGSRPRCNRRHAAFSRANPVGLRIPPALRVRHGRVTHRRRPRSSRWATATASSPVTSTRSPTRHERTRAARRRRRLSRPRRTSARRGRREPDGGTRTHRRARRRVRLRQVHACACGGGARRDDERHRHVRGPAGDGTPAPRAAGRARAAPARLPEPLLVAQPAADDRQPTRRRDGRARRSRGARA